MNNETLLVRKIAKSTNSVRLNNISPIESSSVRLKILNQHNTKNFRSLIDRRRARHLQNQLNTDIMYQSFATNTRALGNALGNQVQLKNRARSTRSGRQLGIEELVLPKARVITPIVTSSTGGPSTTTPAGINQQLGTAQMTASHKTRNTWWCHNQQTLAYTSETFAICAQPRQAHQQHETDEHEAYLERERPDGRE